MCDHHASPPAPRHGAALEHGSAHTEDHNRWSRRNFLKQMGLAMAGGTMMLGHTPIKAMGSPSLLRRLQQLDTDRILIILQLGGGNDGLNTVVPFNNPVYYRNRPTLSLRREQTIRISDELGLHPSLAPLESYYGDGHMAVVQNVGYPLPDLSHFRSTDYWETGSDPSQEYTTGWAGRYLGETIPDFLENPPSSPLAVQIGRGGSRLFHGPDANMGMSLANSTLFERIATTGQLYSMENLPDTTFGREMTFMRRVVNDSFKFSGAIQDATQGDLNSVEYPQGSKLSEHLAIAAQLIKGDLGARIYSVTLNGFDTHANQINFHATLLNDLATSLDAFMRDLEADNLMDRVLIMTYSEFGRRIYENGSRGTDHGSAAPLFVLGGNMNGGVYGDLPDLINLDETENIPYQIDFRSVYAGVMERWFEMPPETVTEVLGGPFEAVPFAGERSTVATHTDELPVGFALSQNYPNPFNPSTQITYTLGRAANIRLRVYDAAGRHVRTLFDGRQPAGTYTRSFDAGTLPSGTYLYRLDTPEGRQTRRMVLVR